jgi:hypothetical protein
VRLEGLDAPVTVYAVPTTEGVATVACLTGAEGTRNCDAIANTVQLVSGEPFRIGPSADYARVVTRKSGTLADAVATRQQALRRADTPRAQARALRRLRDAYRRAARPAGLELSPADRSANAFFVAALKAVADAYGKAASAADGNNDTGYRKAENALARAQKDLTDAYRRLGAAGYEIET